MRIFHITIRLLILSAILKTPVLIHAEPLDWLSEGLTFNSPDGNWRGQLGGWADAEYYRQDTGGANGWIFLKKGHRDLLNPRLSVTADVQGGDWFYGFVKLRWDRGIHPGLLPSVGQSSAARWDEYFLRFSPFGETLRLQIGKYAPPLGNFLGRHDSWDNPFINYPLLYEQVTSVSDGIVNASAAAFVSYRHMPDNRGKWVSVIWAPLYTEGATLMGTIGQWGYALSVTNRSVSSRPSMWNDASWSDPTTIGRVTYQPSANWLLGSSVSQGAYLKATVDRSLLQGHAPGDYMQTTIGLDARYEHRRWQVWGEAIWSRWEIPNAGRADMLSYYFEAKYKLSPHWFLAGRWNHQIPFRLEHAGRSEDWDNSQIRLDGAIGYRWNRNFQVKVQYSWLHQWASLQNGGHLLAVQSTVKW